MNLLQNCFLRFCCQPSACAHSTVWGALNMELSHNWDSYSTHFYMPMASSWIITKMDISVSKRTKILTLHQYCSMTQREIAKLVGVSQASVSCIVRKGSKFGSLSPNRKGRCDRKRKTSPRYEAVLIRESKKNPRKTSDALKKDLESAEVSISSSTVRRRLIEVGHMARRPVKKQLLTMAMKKKRYNWALKFKDWTCENRRMVLFSDESHFFVQGQQSQHVRRTVGEPVTESHINQFVKHPEKKMFWGCFSYYGIGPLHLVEGMMISAQYIDVLKSRVVPEMSKLFPDGSGLFQQDLAPCHTSKVVKMFLQEKAIQVLEWPGNSPDLNPIENLWSIIKQKLRGRDCTTKEKLIEAVIHVWHHDQDVTGYCQSLVDSMPNRVRNVIKNRGAHIMYWKDVCSLNN